MTDESSRRAGGQPARSAARWPLPGPSRRQVLGTSAAVLALAGVPRAARAAAAAPGSQPQTQPQEGRVLASLNGTWDFMPTAGTPAAPPSVRALPLRTVTDF